MQCVRDRCWSACSCKMFIPKQVDLVCLQTASWATLDHKMCQNLVNLQLFLSGQATALLHLPSPSYLCVMPSLVSAKGFKGQPDFTELSVHFDLPGSQVCNSRPRFLCTALTDVSGSGSWASINSMLIQQHHFWESHCQWWVFNHGMKCTSRLLLAAAGQGHPAPVWHGRPRLLPAPPGLQLLPAVYNDRHLLCMHV